MRLSKEPQQRLSIVLPETLQSIQVRIKILQCQHVDEDHEDHLELGGRRELAAGKLEGDLHAAVPDVVVVLHGDDGYMMMSIVMTPCMVMTIDKCG